MNAKEKAKYDWHGLTWVQIYFKATLLLYCKKKKPCDNCVADLTCLKIISYGEEGEEESVKEFQIPFTDTHFALFAGSTWVNKQLYLVLSSSSV